MSSSFLIKLFNSTMSMPAINNLTSLFSEKNSSATHPQSSYAFCTNKTVQSHFFPGFRELNISHLEFSVSHSLQGGPRVSLHDLFKLSRDALSCLGLWSCVVWELAPLRPTDSLQHIKVMSKSCFRFFFSLAQSEKTAAPIDFFPSPPKTRSFSSHEQNV